MVVSSEILLIECQASIIFCSILFKKMQEKQDEVIQFSADLGAQRIIVLDRLSVPDEMSFTP
jgi:hypothetical protein